MNFILFFLHENFRKSFFEIKILWNNFSRLSTIEKFYISSYPSFNKLILFQPARSDVAETLHFQELHDAFSSIIQLQQLLKHFPWKTIWRVFIMSVFECKIFVGRQGEGESFLTRFWFEKLVKYLILIELRIIFKSFWKMFRWKLQNTHAIFIAQKKI
jgi:hypothetical protein